MAQAGQAQALQEALNAHDRVRKSTDLPLYFGRAGKDTVTPNVLLDRINRAAVIARWDTDERKITEFYMILRDRALIWWDSLEHSDIDRAVWADVQKEFLAAYAPKFTARTTCTNFQELVQRSGENVHDYYLRVTEALKHMGEAKPAAMATVRADRGTATEAQATAIKNEGIKDCERFFMHQLFIAGLKEEIRTKIMEAGKTSIQESLALARELEVILNDRKKTGAVTSVEDSRVAKDPEDEAADDEEELRKINAMRQAQGKPPFRFQKKGSSSAKSPMKCRYCKITGHAQKVCRKRIAAGAPMVDAEGKPYTNTGGKVHPVQEGTGNSPDGGLSSLSAPTFSPYGLNWQ